MLFVPVNYTHAHAVTRTSELCAWTGKPPCRRAVRKEKEETQEP